jgi:hypothetical protein
LVLQLAAYLDEKKVAMLVELLGLKLVVMLGLMTAVLMVEMKDERMAEMTADHLVTALNLIVSTAMTNQ